MPFAFSKSNPDLDDSDKKEYAKEIKSLQFIKLSDFKNWIRFDETAGEIAIDDIADTENRPGKITDILRPHNTLDRLSLASQIFHSGTTYFDTKKQSGFYFLLRTDDGEAEKIKAAIKHLLEIISDTGGIGGNRNIGLGAISNFEILTYDQAGSKNKADWEAVMPDRDMYPGNAHCLISLFHPNSIASDPPGTDDYLFDHRKEKKKISGLRANGMTFKKLPGISFQQEFEFDKNRFGVIRYRSFHGQQWESFTMFRGRKQKLPEMLSSPRAVKKYLNTLKPPGIPLKKQWNLYKKVRKHVPDEFKDTLCPEPNDAES
ncbi:hypothetical protein QUF80_04370 [Desulfococcaceae bacterium HSG8]|nr:hypothetical protein [Desulfococcaceae bacterium HSG8]